MGDVASIGITTTNSCAWRSECQRDKRCFPENCRWWAFSNSHPPLLWPIRCSFAERAAWRSQSCDRGELWEILLASRAIAFWSDFFNSTILAFWFFFILEWMLWLMDVDGWCMVDGMFKPWAVGLWYVMVTINGDGDVTMIIYWWLMTKKSQVSPIQLLDWWW